MNQPFTSFSPKPRRPIKPFSDKRLKRLNDRQECVRQVKERANGRCEGRLLLEHRCQGVMDVHEIIPRGRGGSEVEPANCVHICRWLHDWAHANPAQAEQVGLLKPSWERRG